MISQEIFREYDIRGLADKELSPDFVCLLGFALGIYFKNHGHDTVIVGRDNRLSSERIFQDLSIGLATAGHKIVDINTVTTPLFYFSRLKYGINAGVMITASHNPKEFNGFKIALGSGTIYGEEIQKIYRCCAALQGEEISYIENPEISKIDPFLDYLHMLI